MQQKKAERLQQSNQADPSNRQSVEEIKNDLETMANQGADPAAASMQGVTNVIENAPLIIPPVENVSVLSAPVETAPPVP